MIKLGVLHLLRRILSISEPRISSEQALAAVRDAAKQYEWRWITPVVSERLRTYVVSEWCCYAQIRGIVDIHTGEVLRVWMPGHPVTYFGRPIGFGPWLSPQEAGEIARKEIQVRTGYDWIEPVKVSYSIFRRMYVVRDSWLGRDLYTEVEVDPRDGSVKKYFRFAGLVSRKGDPDFVVSEEMDEEKARRTLLLVMGMIVEGRYGELAKLLHEETITVDALQGVVDKYPYRLVMPPAVPFADLVHYSGQMRNYTPRTWVVIAKIWTGEEGVSDIILEMHFIDSPDEYYEVLVLEFCVQEVGPGYFGPELAK